MQPIRVLQTIRWIRQLVPDDVVSVFFSSRLLARRPDSVKEGIPTQVIYVLHEIVRISTMIQQNPEAVEVVKAFGLQRLLNREYLMKYTQTALQGSTAAATDEHYAGIVKPWMVMTGSEKPWQSLTTPEELVAERSPGNVVSIEIQTLRENVPLQSVISTLQSLQNAYSVIAQIYVKQGAESKLDVVSIQSGSPTIRIDCKGIAEAITALKEFVHETWNKLKYRRADELAQNSAALSASLKAIQEVDRQIQGAVIAREEGEQFKKVLLSSAMSLFGAGALPLDIARATQREDNKLLETFMPKLLPGEVEVVEKEKKARKQAHRKKATPSAGDGGKDSNSKRDPTPTEQGPEDSGTSE